MERGTGKTTDMLKEVVSSVKEGVPKIIVYAHSMAFARILCDKAYNLLVESGEGITKRYSRSIEIDDQVIDFESVHQQSSIPMNHMSFGYTQYFDHAIYEYDVLPDCPIVRQLYIESIPVVNIQNENED